MTAFITYLPQHEEFTEKQGEKYAQSADALLYNGPYKLTQFNPTSGAIFVNNKDYWHKENVAIEKIDARIVKEVETAVNLYEAGELDVTELTSECVNRYKDSPAFSPVLRFATHYLDMNQKSPGFRNKNIRKAIQIGFDREALADKILNNGSVGVEGFVPPAWIRAGRETRRSARSARTFCEDPTRSRPESSTNGVSRSLARSRPLRC